MLSPRSSSPHLLAHAWRELASLMTLATPLIASLATASLMGLVDTAMLGPLGALPLAAVSLTTSALVIFATGIYGFLSPVGIRVGHGHGAGDPDAVARQVRAGLHWARLIGVGAGMTMAAALPLLAWLGQPPEVVAIITPYWLAIAAGLLPLSLTLVYKQALDAIDRPWLGVLLAALSVAANGVFNYVLIYGKFGFPALGLAGAGLGTLLALSLGALVHAAVCRRTPSLRQYFAPVVIDTPLRARFAADGTPMGVQYALEGGSFAVAGLFIGWLGAIPLAATQVVMAVAGTLYMVPLGMAAAVGIRIAQAAGGDQHQRLRAIGMAGLGAVTAWMLIVTLILTLAADQIAGLFIDDARVITLAATLFLVIGLMQVFDGVQSVSLGALRGMLDTSWPTRVSLIAYWLLALPLGWLLGFPLGWGAVGVWAGFGLGLAVAAAALLWRFTRLTA